jgi:hypothetical protein
MDDSIATANNLPHEVLIPDIAREDFEARMLTYGRKRLFPVDKKIQHANAIALFEKARHEY